MNPFKNKLQSDNSEIPLLKKNVENGGLEARNPVAMGGGSLRFNSWISPLICASLLSGKPKKFFFIQLKIPE